MVESMECTEQVDSSFQNFSCTFTVASRREKLSFCTFKERASPNERNEILSIYGSREVQLQCSGVDVLIQSEEEVETVRRSNFARNSLFGKSKSIRWKVYYSYDIDVKPHERSFAGLCGLALSPSKVISPAIRVTPEYQNQGIGTKIVFSLLSKFLQNMDWFLANCRGLDINIHPKNTASLVLTNNTLSQCMVENKNPKDANGIWSKTYHFSQDNTDRTLDMRNFVCYDIESLKTLWGSKMERKVNRRDILLSSTQRQVARENMEIYSGKRPLAIEDSNLHGLREELLLETLDEMSHELMDSIDDDDLSRGFVLQKKKVRAEPWKPCSLDIDKNLQNFAYTFDCGLRHEKLSFRTYEGVRKQAEREEILSIFKNIDVDTCGFDGSLGSEKAIENIRNFFFIRNSLCGKYKSIRWKLYYQRDLDMKHAKEEFAGFVGLSILESGNIEPHMRLTLGCQNKGIGTKVILCLFEVLLQHKDWVFANVRGLEVYIDPRNTRSLCLQSKLLSNYAVDGGIKAKTYQWFEDNKYKTMPMRQFICSRVESLEVLWESKMIQKVNTADLLLFDKTSHLKNARQLLLKDVVRNAREKKVEDGDQEMVQIAELLNL